MFEQLVKQRIEMIVPTAPSYFYNGTLFVETTPEQAQEIFEELSLVYENKVQYTHVADTEYAYDFIA